MGSDSFVSMTRIKQKRYILCISTKQAQPAMGISPVKYRKGNKK